jgi:hypothetical protein
MAEFSPARFGDLFFLFKPFLRCPAMSRTGIQ